VANGEARVRQSADAVASIAERSARPIVAGLLLLIVIAGIGAASPAVTGLGPWSHHALALGIGLEVVLAGLQVALAIAARRTRAHGHPAAALRRALHWVIAGAMIVIVIIAIANLEGNKRGNLIQRAIFNKHRPTSRRPAKLPPGLRKGGAFNHANYVLYGLIAVIVVAAIAAAVILVLRARASVRRAAGYADEAAEPVGDGLRQAVDSGRAALRTVDDARAAIIACYAAMEGSLASAGTTRAAAETPDELLTRAVSSGLIRSQAAAQLTRLFYEARFSTRPLAPSARDVARQSLDVISAELADRSAPMSRAGQPAAERGP
jgi:hypothetical protein